MSALYIAQYVLQEMTERYPPNAPRRHALTLADDGALVLTLAINDRFEPITFDRVDLELPYAELIDEIERAKRAPEDPNVS